MSTFGSFALRSGTLHSYATQTRALERLATSYGIDLSKPLSELDLCILISVYATTHKVTSLTTFVSAVAHDARRRFGQDATLPRHGLYRQTRAGIEKFYGDTATPTPKALVYLDDLCTFARLLPRHTFEGARDGCACLLAFYGLLRIREYMDAGLRICDVRSAVYGLDMDVTYSKTSLVRTTLSVAGRGDELCPSQALAAYYAHFSSMGLPARRDDALFISFSSGAPAPMTADEFITACGSCTARRSPTAHRRTTRVILSAAAEPLLSSSRAWLTPTSSATGGGSLTPTSSTSTPTRRPSASSPLERFDSRRRPSPAHCRAVLQLCYAVLAQQPPFPPRWHHLASLVIGTLLPNHPVDFFMTEGLPN